jgi:hypothetical protein
MGHDTPPMDPQTDEASSEQLEAARKQGNAYGEALNLMVTKVAHDGREQRAGDYLIAYAVEEAEGMYVLKDGTLEWVKPENENLHLEIAVRDAADGRFVPCLAVWATLIDPQGREVGTHQQPLLWHPMLYHYGRNWAVPATASTHFAFASTHRHSCAMTRSTADGTRSRLRRSSPV